MNSSKSSPSKKSDIEAGSRHSRTYIGQSRGGAMASTESRSSRYTNIVKLLQSGLGAVCQYLAIEFGVEFAERLGLGYQLFLTCNSGSLMCSFLLFLSYSVSRNTYERVRPTMFEMLLNLLCCALYIASSVMLMTTVFTEFYYTYMTEVAFNTYPALTAVYVLGFVAGALHFIDAVLVFIDWKNTP